ncbi:MAG: FtsW/RodA/SpoVE family cell cycle protein [Alphaproteobacteria bacterium]|nr:FtsW/RodA/SpoVE family cell cycle protein [Alphaproteobacteria bacterium]
MFNRNSKNFLSKWWWQNDKSILLSFFLLIFISIILVITASPFVAIRIGVDPFHFINKHLVFLVIACGVIYFFSTLSKENLIFVVVAGFTISILAMIAVLFWGSETKGASRWLYLPGFSLQPSEFMKVLFPAMLAIIWKKMEISKDKILTSLSLFLPYFIQKWRLTQWLAKNITYLVLFIIYFFVAFLLLKQPDVGTVVLISTVFFGILFITGISYLWSIIIAFICSIGGVFAYCTFPHVHYRVNTFFFEQKSYQVSKAIEAISNGKIFGLGAGQGVVKQYLPDSHTDFIFSVGIEEFGLVFGLFLILIYLNIVYRLFYIIQKQQDSFNIIALSGSMFLLGVQSFIHIASNINLIPTKGMTLPLISYGGSSLISIAILIGLILNLSKKDIQNIILKVE